MREGDPGKVRPEIFADELPHPQHSSLLMNLAAVEFVQPQAPLTGSTIKSSKSLKLKGANGKSRQGSHELSADKPMNYYIPVS